MPETPTYRPCGSCYACCVWLGIESLAKPVGKACKHLSGAQGPLCRCGVYASRPKACQDYHCAWASGLFRDLDRPDQTGILTTLYLRQDVEVPPETQDPSLLSATLMLIDDAQAGTLSDDSSHLRKAVAYLMEAGVTELRVLDPRTQALIYFKDGQIYAGRAFQDGTSVESLTFATDLTKPIGRWELEPRTKTP